MLVVGVIFKAFALTGRKVDCWFTQGECPGLGASAPSGRVGANLRQFRSAPTLKSKACLKCLYFMIIIFNLCCYLEYFSYLYTINQTE